MMRLFSFGTALGALALACGGEPRTPESPREQAPLRASEQVDQAAGAVVEGTVVEGSEEHVEAADAFESSAESLGEGAEAVDDSGEFDE